MIGTIRRLLRVSTLAAVASVMLASAALGPARAACYGPQQQLPAPTIAAFLANPAQLLAQFPNGGGGLISQIRDLVASDPATLPVIIGLFGNANAAQLDSMGFGLGQGALACTLVDQPFSTEIQRAVAAANNDIAFTAMGRALGDKLIGGVGGGAGGASAGAGGGQINPISGLGTFSGGPTTFNSFGTRNAGTNLFTSSSLTPGSSSTTTTTTSTVISVSPSQ